MFRKKIYGASKIDECFICGEQSTIKNKQGLTTCQKHKDEELLDVKCACGDWLDIKQGKYGTFFLCMQCGPINLKKGLEINGYPLKTADQL
ncbi:hypothetical protein K9L97_04170 [Candidatus Woesearchaeota archaeon]|nr:hypothetical protein [Candidatus Woesearchaeota archaeon]